MWMRALLLVALSALVAPPAWAQQSVTVPTWATVVAAAAEVRPIEVGQEGTFVVAAAECPVAVRDVVRGSGFAETRRLSAPIVSWDGHGVAFSGDISVVPMSGRDPGKLRGGIAFYNTLGKGDEGNAELTLDYAGDGWTLSYQSGMQTKVLGRLPAVPPTARLDLTLHDRSRAGTISLDGGEAIAFTLPDSWKAAGQRARIVPWLFSGADTEVTVSSLAVSVAG